MIGRIVSTAVLVLLAAGAFVAQMTFAEKTDSTVFLVFGVVCLLLAVLDWFAWPTIRAGWDAGRPLHKTGPDLPVSASFWPVYIGGLLNAVSRTHPHQPKLRETDRGGDPRA